MQRRALGGVDAQVFSHNTGQCFPLHMFCVLPDRFHQYYFIGFENVFGITKDGILREDKRFASTRHCLYMGSTLDPGREPWSNCGIILFSTTCCSCHNIREVPCHVWCGVVLPLLSWLVLCSCLHRAVLVRVYTRKNHNVVQCLTKKQ